NWQPGAVTLNPLFVARWRPQLERPIGPGDRLVLLCGRLRHDLEIGHRKRALADRRADAVGPGITAADHHHMLASREDRLDAVLRLVVNAPVLLRQEGHPQVNAPPIAAPDRPRPLP